MKGFFPRLDRGDFLAHVVAGAHLACGGEGFKRVGPVVRPRGAEMKNNKASSNASSGFESGEGVAFGQAAGGRAWIGKFVGIGVGA